MASAYIYLALIYISISLPISLLIKESPWRVDARSDAISEERHFLFLKDSRCMDKFCCNFLLRLHVSANNALGTIADRQGF